jgi:hypothetical protein
MLIESGLKSNPRGFFKYADMKRNSNGYPLSMFFGCDYARDSQNIANEISEDEVECTFLGLDVNKGPEPDGITPAILKRLATIVKVPLTYVFNLSLSAGVSPAIWKESFVVLI